MSPRTKRHGFTLIEVLAVLALLSLVLLVAVDFYLELSRSTGQAAEATRETRRAVAIVDRVAKDLESAYLLKKPAETDPLEWPYLFLAEGDGDAGAERLKWVSQGHRPKSAKAVESDLAIVSWRLGETEEGERALFRWTSPRLPEGLDRTFPSPDDEGSMLVAEGVRTFGVRLLSEEGEWTSNWDSSTLLESSQLPIAAEVVFAFDDGDDAPEEDPDADGGLRRHVLLPLRPLDLEALRAPGGVAGFVAQNGGSLDGEGVEGEDGELEDLPKEESPNCVTVFECFQRHPEALEAVGMPMSVFQSIGNECFTRYEYILRNNEFFTSTFGISLADCL